MNMRVLYAAVASSLMLAATILVAPLGITNSFKLLPEAEAARTGVHFSITDDPGSWFRNDDSPPIGATDSLAVTTRGNTVFFNMDESNTVHTVTSLLWPTGATNMPFDQPEAFNGDTQVKLWDAGLYVFVCKLHPFMLGAVIVDNPATQGLDLGGKVDMINGITDLPTNSDLVTRLVRGFYVITGPSAWQDFSQDRWVVDFPSVEVRRTGGEIVNLDVLDIDQALPPLMKPSTKGVGEIWVATQYEQTEGKDKPGTLTVVDADTWKVTRKVALPEIEMNNPHNLWTDRNQRVIYATQWFDEYLTTVNRANGELKSNVKVGDAPAHVMTRVDTDEVHVSINGEHSVVELKPGGGSVTDTFDVTKTPLDPGANPAQPHAHWMGFDGKTMVTPNSNTGDSTLYDFNQDKIVAKPETGVLPIATGMMPDSSKYYVSNFLSNTISVVSMKGPSKGAVIETINLLEDYDPIKGVPADGDLNNDGDSIIGALPIQTPVSPNGKYLVTANTLTATITIVDTDTDKAIKTLACDAGCHGVQFGAKKGGGYYAYVTSKFANTLIVVDIDPNNNGDAKDAKIVGRILLAATNDTKTDDDISGYSGMGGQGVLPVPLVYNGWVQNLPQVWKDKLSNSQLNPIG
jgi:6-phosphogluconolactonase (cycloisomerase 2 family)